jgi:hypothetical protein
VLHTWSQTLLHHPHVHGLVSGGALRASGAWQPAKPGFLFPVQALSRVFRGKYLDALNALRADNRLSLPEDLIEPTQWAALINVLRRQPWVVYLKPPLSGPQHVLEYLARYTHRVALSNDRLVSISAEEVCLRYRDAAHGNARRLMRLPPQEFLRRCLLHVLPARFKRIRHYGLLWRPWLGARSSFTARKNPAPASAPVHLRLHRTRALQDSACSRAKIRWSS